MISDTAIPLRFQTAEVGVDWLQCNIECQEGCPVNTNCRGYLMLAAEGRFEEGYILARDPNPVAAICGYVCSAPCEKACRRADIDKPLAIRAMKRFLVDWHYGNNMPDNVVVQPPTGRRIAIVGAGPAGLATAKELASWGHEVHIFEALPSGGGTTLIGVPAFRLPRDVIELDVNWVAKHGVQFHYNVEIGRDITLEQLRADHDAVIVATGCMYPVAMNTRGEELDGVIYGVDFLKRANLGQPQWVGEHVVIIGGGYTAMDSARTALRLGAKTSTIVYRRGPEEMVVDEEEIHETRFEGVGFELFSSPVEVLSDENGREVQLNQIGPGEYFGEVTLDGGPRSASVMALEECRCAVVRRAELTAFLERYPEFAQHVVRKLAHRVRVLTESVRSLALMDVYGRVARLLLELAEERDGVLVVGESLTQRDIAARVGCSREMISRIFSDLTDGGYVRREARHLVIVRKPPPRW